MIKGNLNSNQIKDLKGMEEYITILTEVGYINADNLSDKAFDQLSNTTWLILDIRVFKGDMVFKRLI